MPVPSLCMQLGLCGVSELGKPWGATAAAACLVPLPDPPPCCSRCRWVQCWAAQEGTCHPCASPSWLPHGWPACRGQGCRELWVGALMEAPPRSTKPPSWAAGSCQPPQGAVL